MSNELAIDNHNIVSSEFLNKELDKFINKIKVNPNAVHNIPVPMLRGAPGVGKSSIVRDAAKRNGVNFVDVRLAQMERVDICGLPSVENGVTKWNAPDFWPRDMHSNGIIFFDEITSAPHDVQVAAYSIVLDRCIPNSNYKLPDGWLIVAAGNRAIDRAVVKTMSSALANRLSHFELEANVESWLEWAEKHDINPAVTGFIRYRPQYLFTMDKQNLEQGWPSPRSWEKVSCMIDLFADDDEMLRPNIFGLIGPSVGIEFLAFLKINKQFDNVLDVLTDPKKKVTIPTRSDEKYAYVSAVIYHLWNGTDAEDQRNRVDGFYRIANELTPDFCTMLVKAAMHGNSKVSTVDACKQIMCNKAYKSAAAKFAAALKNNTEKSI